MVVYKAPDAKLIVIQFVCALAASFCQGVAALVDQAGTRCGNAAQIETKMVRIMSKDSADCEDDERVSLLQLQPKPVLECPPPAKFEVCQYSEQDKMEDRSVSILLRGEPFRVGEHGKSSVDPTGVGYAEQMQAAESHVKFLIKSFENSGFMVEVVGVIPKHIAEVSSAGLRAMEEIYRPWMPETFHVVDSKSQGENWKLAWRELDRKRKFQNSSTFVLRYDAILKTNIAQLISQDLKAVHGKMLIPFYDILGVNEFSPGSPKLSDIFQWVPHHLERCVAANGLPIHQCGWKTYAKLIGAEHIGALWQNPGSFPGCPGSTTNPQYLPNALYRLAGRPEGQSVTGGECPFLS